MPAFVEAKLELVQVPLKMLGADSVIGASQPGLEIAENRMSPRQAILGVSSVTSLARAMVDSHFCKCRIGRPGVGMNCRSPGHNRALNK